jgi:hypothetical protein
MKTVSVADMKKKLLSHYCGQTQNIFKQLKYGCGLKNVNGNKSDIENTIVKTIFENLC